MESLDPTQRAARDQFGRQSDRYGRGHVLEQVGDLQEALARLPILLSARVLDVATGAGHAGLFFAGDALDEEACGAAAWFDCRAACAATQDFGAGVEGESALGFVARVAGGASGHEQGMNLFGEIDLSEGRQNRQHAGNTINF